MDKKDTVDITNTHSRTTPAPLDGDQILTQLWEADAKAKQQRLVLTPDKYQFALQILADKEGSVNAAQKELALHKSSIYSAMTRDPAFAEAVRGIQEVFRLRRLSQLEVVSIEEALKPKNVRERIFQLGAHDPEKYRDRKAIGPSAINIQFGFQVPKFAQGLKDKVKGGVSIDTMYSDPPLPARDPDEIKAEAKADMDAALKDAADYLPAPKKAKGRK